LDQVALGNPSYVWRFGQERRLEMIRRYIPLEGATVLDIGSGIGTYVRRFGELGATAYGIEIDVSRVRRGVEAGIERQAIGVGESLPFPDASFDGILLNEVIEHVTDDHATFAEALRVTKPGGRVVVFAPNRLYPFETHGIYVGKRFVFANIPFVNYLPDALRNRLVPHARVYTKGRLEAITRGLPGRWIAWKVIYPGFDNVLERKPAIGRFLRKLTYRLEETWLHRFGLSHLLVLERVPDNA
jgi:SAM-dependent methyltransferase